MQIIFINICGASIRASVAAMLMHRYIIYQVDLTFIQLLLIKLEPLFIDSRRFCSLGLNLVPEIWPRCMYI